jgi:hypothetical protein
VGSSGALRLGTPNLETDLSRLQMILLLQNSVMKQDEFASK